MKPTAFAILGALLAFSLLPSAAAQDIEIYIFENIENEPLEAAAKRIAAMGLVEVTVEKEIREKTITVKLQSTPEEALGRIARAAGAYLWKTGPKTFEIRRAPPPGEAEKAKAAADAAAALPEWARTLAKKLEETEVSFRFSGEPLSEALEWLAKETGVPIRLDPRVLEERTKQQLEVHIAEFDEKLRPGNILDSGARALGMVLSGPGMDLDRTWRFGGVWISTREHVRELPEALLAPAAGEEAAADAAARKALEAKRIDLKCARATLEKTLRDAARKGGVALAIDRDLVKPFAKERITLDEKEILLGDALGLLLLPRGLALELVGGKLAVRRAGE